MQLLFVPSLRPLLANCLLGFVLLLAEMAFCSLANAGSLHRLRFDHFSIDQGLPSTGIMTVYQTRNGFVWMGTANGLVRYDGRHIRLFSHAPANENSISHDRIFSLFEDDQQRLWIGTRRGLNVLDLRKELIQRIAMPADMDLKQQVVYGITQADRGGLWIATAAGLMLFDPTSQQFTRWRAEGAVSGEFVGEVRALISDNQTNNTNNTGNKVGAIWIGQGQTIARIDHQGKLTHRVNISAAHAKAKALAQSSAQVRSLAFDRHGQLWVGLTDGLQIWTLQQNQLKSLTLPSNLKLPNATITAILQDHEHAMWLGMGDDQGLLRWRDDQQMLEKFRNRPSVNSSLSGDSITSLMQDASGGLWVGTSDYGANLVDLKGRSFTSYLNIPGDERSLSHRLVTAVLPDGNEHAWLGTLGGGLNRLHLASGETQRFTQQQMGVEYIRALMLDSKKQLWVGGERLQIFNPIMQSSRDLELDKSFPIGARFTSLVQDQHGDVWAGTSVGLYRIKQDGSFRIYNAELNRPDWINDDAIDSLLIDQQQRLWVGSKGGLFIFDSQTEKFLAVGKPSAWLPTPHKLGVTALRQDKYGRIWAATILGGLLEVKPVAGAVGANAWELVSWADIPQIPKDVIEAMQDAENGEIWMSSERGLMRVRPETREGHNFPSFGRFDGAFNFAAATRMPDGSMLFGGVGLTYFHPQNIWENRVAPRVVLSDILLFNKSLTMADNQTDSAANTNQNTSKVGDAETTATNGLADLKSLGIDGPLSASKQIKLDHTQTMVSFELAALHFYNRTQNRYAWKLEGYDQDWIYGQGDRSVATYTNLDARTYRLMAKAANPDGVWGESTEILTVVVTPPFWRTWWWYGMWIVIGLSALRFAYHVRLKAIRENQLYLEQQVKAQTQEVLAQKKLAEAQREIAERARNDIGRLSEIGLQITSSLDKQEILNTLYQNIRSMVRASTFGVGIVDWDRRVISFEYTVQGDQLILPYERSLDAEEQPAARCVLSGQELIVNEIAHDSREIDSIIAKRSGEVYVRLEDGTPTEDSRSGVYVPIILGGRVMGVVGALSKEANAFSLNDLNILRTLASYTGVAYDNAEAYRRLKITQSKLVEQEKLAALGSLVAGVAHELNTPIGNSLLMASTMQEMTEEFLHKVKENQLRRSDLESYTLSAISSSDLMVRSLTSAANLVSSFKQIAVDQTSDQRRSFDLNHFCQEVALTLFNRSKREGHEIRVEIAGDLVLDSYPGSLGQVLNNLIINAMVHGFNERKNGLILIRGRALDAARVELIVEDNGVGIAQENRERIFEPFFTTRLGTGGSGLGLHICYNIIHSILGGSIKVQSEFEQGSRFIMVLPLVAPDPVNQVDQN